MYSVCAIFSVRWEGGSVDGLYNGILFFPSPVGEEKAFRNFNSTSMSRPPIKTVVTVCRSFKRKRSAYMCVTELALIQQELVALHCVVTAAFLQKGGVPGGGRRVVLLDYRQRRPDA